MAESADIGPPSDCQLWAAAASAQRAFSSDCDDATVTAGWLQPSAVFKEPEGTHRIHGAAIYGNMDPINIPPMLAYIPAPWILWGMEIASRMFNGRPSKTDINWMLYMNISRVTTSALIGSCSPHLQWHSKLVSLRAFLGVPCGLRKAPQSWNRLIIVTPKKIQKRVSRMVYIHDIYIYVLIGYVQVSNCSISVVAAIYLFQWGSGPSSWAGCDHRSSPHQWPHG